MRIDQYLSKSLGLSRKEAKELIQMRKITVNELLITNSNTIVDEANDIIKKDGTTISYEKNIYIMLNKPKGYITANFDKNEKTVMELINHPRKKDLFPVGRLDKDTTGLLLITNNGKIAHELLSPKKHVEKTYIVKTDGNMDIAEKTLLENGVVLDGELTKKAKVKVFSDKTLSHISITEGKYHQVKRMYQCVGLNVMSLKRISFGPLVLDEKLKEGESRLLLKEEIALLEKEVITKGK